LELLVTIAEFLNEIILIRKAGGATEHSYRPAFAKLFEALDPEVAVTNEAKRVTEAGSPDFTFRRQDKTRGFLTIGHCECKDFGLDVRHPQGYSSEQKERYLEAFPNLMYSNGIDWIFYRNHQEEPINEIRIADPDTLSPDPEKFEQLHAQLIDFVAQKPKSITTSKDLAARMAAKAKLIRFVFQNELKRDVALSSELAGQFKAFQEYLIHDISIDDFAGIYAETITYGLFAARLQDRATPEDFSRLEAAELLPKSNPFLRELFKFIASSDLDEGLVRAVDDLVEIFLVSHPWEIMAEYGKSDARNDPFLHFYEDFLAAYDKEKRKSRGVWYTPEPVVDFIVRAVDDILKHDFRLPLGLADTSKTTIKLEQQRGLTTKGKKAKRAEFINQEVHRVQILDPAVGTGTFLAHAIKHISSTISSSVGSGAWRSYVENDLIPRLHGFELLMASYAMCHLKIDMELKATGYTPTDNPPRASIYLTNSLEEGEPRELELPFAPQFAKEVRLANEVKSEKPIMVVIGNPPYLGEGGRSEGWLSDLLEPYKKEPGGQIRLQERNPKWLNDLYVKFMRLAEYMIEENGEGVVGFITNHGYLDNPTFRGMRWHLLNTFDHIYVLDLHGNTKKKEISPDGSPDSNVFDIQQGVAIIIAVKRRNAKDKEELAQVYRADLWGSRQKKYDALLRLGLKQIEWAKLENRSPRFPFVDRDWSLSDKYESGWSLTELFGFRVLGFQTHRDKFAIAFEQKVAIERFNDLRDANVSDHQIIAKYDLKESNDWNIADARRRAQHLSAEACVTKCHYRPFDSRWCILDAVATDRPRPDLNKHLVGRENYVLLVPRQLATLGYNHAFVANAPAESCVISTKTKEQNNNFPLFLYPDENDLDQSRRVNFEPKLYKKIRESAGLGDPSENSAKAIFDYIYGVLHCPSYRATYAEYLKVDFPRIPWASSPEQFRDVSSKGGELRRLHLMEADGIGDCHYPLCGDGNAQVQVGFPKYVPTGESIGDVHINETQRFSGVPEVSWEFWVGSYQPAQKWLKDRRGRSLSTNDLIHYQHMIWILAETDRIVKSIELGLD
jgi:predicted helicase